jgi:DNA-binding response OmpR family regulator
VKTAPKSPPRAPAIRVLVVEPNQPTRELLGQYLRGRGMIVTLVDSASAARVEWAGPRPDVLLTETALPDAECAEVLRQCQGAAGLLAMSSALSVPEAIATMQSGADDVLLKPLRLREVYDAIRGCALRARTRERERLARDLFLGAARCQTASEAGALRAILNAETALFAADPALAVACDRLVALAEQQCP